MLQLTITPTPGDGPAWDRGLPSWARRGRGPHHLVLLTSGLALADGDERRGDPTALGALLRHSGLSPRRVLVAGPGALVHGSSAATGYGALLARGLAVVPRPVLEGRDGLPAVRRALARWEGGQVALVLDAAIADRAALNGPAVAVARALVAPDRAGAPRLTALWVAGWPHGDDAPGEPRGELVARILRTACAPV